MLLRPIIRIEALNVVKRISILPIALLSLVVAACSGGTSASAPASAQGASTAPSAPASSAAAPESAAPSSGTGSTSALIDLLPDRIGGMDHGEDIDFGNNEMFKSILAQQGGAALGDVEYIIRSWGEDAQVTLRAMRIPSMPQPQLELIAKAMSGSAGAQGSLETTNIGGKQVLRIESSDGSSEGAAYMYFAEGAAFTVLGEEALVAEVLAALP